MPLPASHQTAETFHVRKADFRQWRWDAEPIPAETGLAPGQLIARVAKFAFTANNVTYARLGDQLGYWKFFPAAEGWGCIPVWGIAEVLHSSSPDIAPGERIHGYMPMASHVLLQPGALRGIRFSDGTPHRAALPPVYNEYTLIDRDRGYDRAREDTQLILRPLFGLSFFCAQYLQENTYFGARRILISSASSKTALGLAFLLAQSNTAGLEIVGLTSAANVGFVEQTGRYGRVLPYDAIGSIGASEKAAFVDVAGNEGVRAAVHHALGDALLLSLGVGVTHWDMPAANDPLPGPAPQFFFTPDHILRARKEWGPELLRERLSAAWAAFADYTSGWLRISTASGKAGIETVYEAVLRGARDPAEADIVTFGGQ